MARVVEAMGGAARIAEIQAYSASGTIVAETPQGAMTIAGTVLIDFPSRLRQEMSMPFGDLVMVVDDEGGFMQMPQGTQPMPDSQRRQAAQEIARNLISIVQNVGTEGFSASLAGEDEVDGKSLDLVVVETGGESLTLGVDRASGLVVSMTYRGTGFGGSPGEMVDVYSDYREVDGVQLPFSKVSTFDGKPASSLTIDSIELDGAVEDSLFERPAA